MVSPNFQSSGSSRITFRITFHFLSLQFKDNDKDSLKSAFEIEVAQV